MPARRNAPRFAEIVRTLPRRAHDLPRRTVRESQRWRMLEAIAEAVAKRGYAEASVADVIAIAGVSRKTFYEHFRDKEACFLTAYAVLSQRLIDAMNKAGEDRAPGRARLRAQLTIYLDVLARDPVTARAFNVDVLGAGAKALAARERVNAAFGIAVMSESVDAVRRMAIVGGVSAIVVEALLDDRAAELPELLDQVCAFMERAQR
jgi:AcrR family transcriptional regulator